MTETIKRKTRVTRMGVNETGGCWWCHQLADWKVQISTPNGRSYRTCELLCNRHRTAENVAEAIQAANLYLEDLS